MSKIAAALSVECKKLFRSRVPLVSLLALVLVPFVGGFFMLILKDPEMARRIGLIAAKAHIAGSADWPSYLGLLAQAIAIGGLMVFGFVTSWIFGREHSDRTVKDLLALPISRGIIVFAKFLITFLWCLLLAVLIFALGMVVGNAIDIPGWSI
jgi:ABC-2 type transport system permease protein